MKKYLSLILALCLPALLGGCGAVPLPMPESPTPPPAADTEEIMKCPPTPMNKR